MRGEVGDPVEEYETIPWEALLDDEPGGGRRWLPLLAGAIVVLAVAAAATRALFPGEPVAPVPVVASDTPEASPAPSSPESAAPSASPPPPSASSSSSPSSTLSEAELLSSSASELLAASRAAWFASGHFTRDGAGGVGNGSLAYVEEVGVAGVAEVGPGRYAVTLLLRILADPGDGYRRLPPRAVEVVVDLTGPTPVVVDLPAPAPVPELGPTEHRIEESEPPPEVVEAALRRASAFGTADAGSVVAGRVGSLWRVALEVADPAGLSWDLVVWADDDGRVVPAGG